MSEMVERVAKALYAADGYKLLVVDAAWEADRVEIRERYRSLAVVAIEAMREPTIDMQVAGFLTNEIHGHFHGANTAWRAMIDAALR